MTRSARTTLTPVLVLVLVLSACSSDLDDGGGGGSGATATSAGPTGPTVAPARFDGLFSATELRLDGVDEQPLGPIVFDIDAEFGTLAIETPCGTLLGSFTLADGGEASITIAGRSSPSCPEEAEAQVERLQATLAAVDAWVDTDHGFDLITPTNDHIALTG